MLNAIKLHLKNYSTNTNANNIINVSKTIQSNINKDVFLLFQKEPFYKINPDLSNNKSNTESDSEFNSEDTEDYSEFKNVYDSDSESGSESDSDLEIRSESDSDPESELDSDPEINIIKQIISKTKSKPQKNNNKKKVGSNNYSSISYQYDISELINAIK